jgi:glycosyltransferase involved in cell wall biosynthesis
LAKYLNQPKIDRLLNLDSRFRLPASPCEAWRAGGNDTRKIDVYFNPHFFNAPVSGKCRKIITFHDLSFVRYPEFFSWRKRLWQRFLIGAKKEAKTADRIIAVSESTKEDLVNLFKIKEEKIKVIYSGVGEQFKPISVIQERSGDFCHCEEVRRLADDEAISSDNQRDCFVARSAGWRRRASRNDRLPKRFILYFGTIEPRKNIIGLIRAFELLKDKEIKLVIAGAKGWLCQDIFKAAGQSKRNQDIFFTGFVQEEDKPLLYNLAELFVYPSFFEGFGFPPLEAMACGVPTIVSNTSSLPEVVGSAAIMVNPYDISEIAWAMEIALSGKELREKMKQEGIEQAKKFSWDKTSQETLQLLTR